ncbi:MAG: class I SAM-dependent methyltransferase [Spirochaetia bacterium]|nr:class I SAM-dependent methyltransferase [Spirochaetia bacterium]
MKNREVWSRHYESEKSNLEIPDENVVRFLNKYFQKQNNQIRALDLGSGSGRHSRYLQKFNAQVYSYDFSHNILAKMYATDSLDIENSNGANKSAGICGVAESLPFKSNSFDLILSWGVLHYLTRDAVSQSISEIYRVLKKKGEILATIRSDKDTHLSSVLKTGDLKEGIALLYSYKDAINLFSKFKNIEYGFISRQPIGDEKIVAHHIFKAQK